jgi:hypothetical protein
VDVRAGPAAGERAHGQSVTRLGGASAMKPRFVLFQWRGAPCNRYTPARHATQPLRASTEGHGIWSSVGKRRDHDTPRRGQKTLSHTQHLTTLSQVKRRQRRPRRERRRGSSGGRRRSHGSRAGRRADEIAVALADGAGAHIAHALERVVLGAREDHACLGALIVNYTTAGLIHAGELGKIQPRCGPPCSDAG